MKKHIFCILLATLTLSGCSLSRLNPFGEKPSEEKVEEAKFVPNPFLWQAAKEKLAFMNIEKEEINLGLLETSWSKVGNIANEEFKIKVQVLASSLRSDCLKVEVKKRLRLNNHWQEPETDRRLAHEVEMAILNQSRILYQKSLVNKKD